MKIHKLTLEERSKEDAIGWFAILTYTEREQGYKYFNNWGMDVFIDIFKRDKDIDLYKVYVEDKEIGRFGVRNNDNVVYCLTGIIIYKKYRNKGHFKDIINYLQKKYTNLCLYPSNKYISNSFKR